METQLLAAIRDLRGVSIYSWQALQTWDPVYDVAPPVRSPLPNVSSYQLNAQLGNVTTTTMHRELRRLESHGKVQQTNKGMTPSRWTLRPRGAEQLQTACAPFLPSNPYGYGMLSLPVSPAIKTTIRTQAASLHARTVGCMEAASPAIMHDPGRVIKFMPKQPVSYPNTAMGVLDVYSQLDGLGSLLRGEQHDRTAAVLEVLGDRFLEELTGNSREDDRSRLYRTWFEFLSWLVGLATLQRSSGPLVLSA
jgi:hypothetical protein